MHKALVCGLVFVSLFLCTPAKAEQVQNLQKQLETGVDVTEAAKALIVGGLALAFLNQANKK